MREKCNFCEEQDAQYRVLLTDLSTEAPAYQGVIDSAVVCKDCLCEVRVTPNNITWASL